MDQSGVKNHWRSTLDMKTIFLAFIGSASGFTTAAALVAMIATIGVLNRLAQMTHSANRIRWYEVCFMTGGILGNLIYLFEIQMQGLSLLCIGGFTLFMGIYLGCFIGALAEVIQIFPIIFHRLHLRMGLKVLIFSMAIGKAIGGIIDFFG